MSKVEKDKEERDVDYSRYAADAWMLQRVRCPATTAIGDKVMDMDAPFSAYDACLSRGLHDEEVARECWFWAIYVCLERAHVHHDTMGFGSDYWLTNARTGVEIAKELDWL